MEGIVIKWLTSYGFIDADEVDRDVFVHESDIQSGLQLRNGQQVTFDLKEEPRGPKAIHVELAE